MYAQVCLRVRVNGFVWLYAFGLPKVCLGLVVCVCVFVFCLFVFEYVCVGLCRRVYSCV